MLEAIRPALVITRREFRDQLRDWRIIFPFLALTIFFPFLMNFTAGQMLGFVQQYGANIIGERLVPFLLMIVGFFPVSVSMVIALETFVGEKERGSIEPLLNSPLKDWQLYLGKLLSSTVPPILMSMLGMSVYLIGLVVQGIPLPDPELFTIVIMLTVMQAVVMVAGGVVVSSQATSVRAANLLSSFIVIPIAMLVQVEVATMFWGGYSTLWWIVIGMVVLAALLIRVGLAQFQREHLLGRDIDVLNFKWGWTVFKRQFTSGAHTLKEWYRGLFRKSLPGLWLAVGSVVSLVVFGILIGTSLIGKLDIQFSPGQLNQMRGQLSQVGDFLPIFSVQPFFFYWWQNVRVLLLSFVLGMFSFGVLGVFPLMATMAITGGLVAFLGGTGLIPASTVILLLIPHGIFEIPAAILACAAMLKAGAVLASPASGKSVGEIWIMGIAEWVRVLIGLVIPLLFIAAAIETWITPLLAVALLR